MQWHEGHHELNLQNFLILQQPFPMNRKKPFPRNRMAFGNH